MGWSDYGISSEHKPILIDRYQGYKAVCNALNERYEEIDRSNDSTILGFHGKVASFFFYYDHDQPGRLNLIDDALDYLMPYFLCRFNPETGNAEGWTPETIYEELGEERIDSRDSKFKRIWSADWLWQVHKVINLLNFPITNDYFSLYHREMWTRSIGSVMTYNATSVAEGWQNTYDTAMSYNSRTLSWLYNEMPKNYTLLGEIWDRYQPRVFSGAIQTFKAVVRITPEWYPDFAWDYEIWMNCSAYPHYEVSVFDSGELGYVEGWNLVASGSKPEEDEYVTIGDENFMPANFPEWSPRTEENRSCNMSKGYMATAMKFITKAQPGNVPSGFEFVQGS